MNQTQRKNFIKKLGGPSRLARQLRDQGEQVTRQAIEQWISLGFPAERVRLLSEVSGVSPAKIRPDLYAWLETPKEAQNA